MLPVQDELRDDLMALLAAGRELTPDSDVELATVFLDRLQRRSRRASDTRYWQVSRRASSIAFVTIVWLAAAAILVSVPYYYYTHDSDIIGGYYSQTVPTVLITAVTLSLIVWAANLTQWRLPRVNIDLASERDHR